MATFTDFSNILPDPNNKITTAGDYNNTTGDTGVGFKSITLKSIEPLLRDRTNSGRLISRGIASQRWEISITYNPMTREQFDIINSFLFSKRGGLIPFYISLPQYLIPKNTTFASYVSTNTTTISGTSALAGINEILIDVPEANGDPSPGDLFTFTDSGDSNHTKAYKVTRVETNALYKTTSVQPTVAQRRLHFSPSLSRALQTKAIINFHNPLIRVVLKNDIQEYSLGANNLYSYSLQLEEALA